MLARGPEWDAGWQPDVSRSLLATPGPWVKAVRRVAEDIAVEYKMEKSCARPGVLVTHSVTGQGTTHLRLTALAVVAGRRRAGELASSTKCLFICGSKRSVCLLM